MAEKSCGTVLVTLIDGVRHYVLIKPVDGINCSFPKGHVEGDETEKQTALRETWEETSINANIVDDFRQEIYYKLPSGIEKTVVFFIGEYSNQVPKLNSGYESHEFFVLPYEKARELITFDSSVELLDMAEKWLSEKEKTSK